jgi:hypothetical protein
VGLAAGEMKAEGMALFVCFQMDFGRDAAARTPERLGVLRLLCQPRCARTMVEWNICTRCALSLKLASVSKTLSVAVMMQTSLFLEVIAPSGAKR